MKARTMTKAQFVSNTCCLWWDTWNLHEGFASVDFASAVHPAVMYDATSSDEFLVDAHHAGSGDHVLEVWRITNPGVCCVAGSQASPTWHQHDISVGSFPVPPNAAQTGSDTIATGDTRPLFAFVQGDKLALGQTTACSDGSGGFDACAAFTEIAIAAYPNGMSLLNDWVMHFTNGTDEYFPAVAPDAAGDRTMVFTRSSAAQDPTAMFAGIPSAASCPSCALTGPAILAGTSPVPCGTSPCTATWGDYQGAARDPDGTGIWIAGQGIATVGSKLSRVTQVALTNEAGDFTPPVTTLSTDPPATDNAFIMGKPIDVTLTSTDAGVGPWKISYKVTTAP